MYSFHTRIREDYIGFPPKIRLFLAASVLILYNICCFLRKIKGLINATTWWKLLNVTHLQHKSVSKGEGVRIFQKNILSENNFFAKDYQENTTLCLLQPKILGKTIYARITDAYFLSDL